MCMNTISGKGLKYSNKIEVKIQSTTNTNFKIWLKLNRMKYQQYSGNN